MLDISDIFKDRYDEIQMEVYSRFSKWLDNHLSSDLPNNVIAVNFNLYEGVEKNYNIEFVGCGTFDADDEDWVCNEVFTTREDLFCVYRADDISNWQQGLIFITALVKKYLEEGTHANKLKKYAAVGIGFVDGNIEILHQSLHNA